MLLLVWWLLTGRAGGTLTQAGLALIAGGATGNLIDRVLHGGVTDFMELRAGSFRLAGLQSRRFRDYRRSILI